MDITSHHACIVQHAMRLRGMECGCSTRCDVTFDGDRLCKVVIPGHLLAFGNDIYDVTYKRYVGNDWHADHRDFARVVWNNARAAGSQRTYVLYRGVCMCAEVACTHTHVGVWPDIFRHIDAPHAEHALRQDEQDDIPVVHVFSMFTSFMHDLLSENSP